MESRLSSSEEVEEEDGHPRSLQAEMPLGLLSHGREHQSYSEMSPAVRPNTIEFEIFIVNWEVTSLQVDPVGCLQLDKLDPLWVLNPSPHLLLAYVF